MKSIINSAGVVSACILLSRILGFVRDMLCTGFFGVAWDAFIFAFTIPNLFRRLFGEGALSAAFIPTFSQYIHNKEASETMRFISIVITMLFGFLSLVSAAVIIGTLVIPYIIPSFQQSVFIMMSLKLLRIMIFYMPLICLVALLQAILNSLKHFAMPALASVVLNICWIGGFVVAARMETSDENKVTIMAWAILIGGIMEVIIQLPALRANKIKYKPEVNFSHPGFREVLSLMGPTVFGLAVFQVNLLVDYIIAKGFVPEPGAISALYFGNRLMQFPFALIGVSLATVIFPLLAEYVAKSDIKGMVKQFNHSVALVLFVGIPASVGLVVLAHPLIHWAFYVLPSGLFKIKALSLEHIDRTAAVLTFYSLGIWAYSTVQIINRAFYSLKDMRTPVKVGIYTVLANLILNLILVQFFKESGIALATTISAVVNMVVLLNILGKRINAVTPEVARNTFFWHAIKSSILPVIFSLVMGAICYLGMKKTLPSDEVIRETMRIAMMVGSGAVCYGILALVFQRKLLMEMLRKKV
jgi:putative peptidoglycan lipid II flippase